MLTAIVCAPCGCARNSATDASANSNPSAPSRSTAELGPVKVELEIKPGKARLSDTLDLTVTTRSMPGVKIDRPEFDKKVGGFDVLSVRDGLPSVEDGRDVARWTVELEPQSVGQLAAGPLAVRFTDARTNGDGKTHTLQIEPISVEVTSSVDPASASLDRALQSSGRIQPIGLDEPRMSPWALAAISLLAIAFLTAAVKMVRHRQKEDEAPPPAPADLAADEFLALEQAGWIETDPKRFYLELTGIVRRYIERTTNIHAPEQTTEEFLRECERNPIVPWTRRDRLRDFLEAADLVKFAAYQPGRNAMDESLRTARRLVDQAPDGPTMASLVGRHQEESA